MDYAAVEAYAPGPGSLLNNSFMSNVGSNRLVVVVKDDLLQSLPLIKEEF